MSRICVLNNPVYVLLRRRGIWRVYLYSDTSFRPSRRLIVQNDQRTNIWIDPVHDGRKSGEKIIVQKRDRPPILSYKMSTLSLPIPSPLSPLMFLQQRRKRR